MTTEDFTARQLEGADPDVRELSDDELAGVAGGHCGGEPIDYYCPNCNIIKTVPEDIHRKVVQCDYCGGPMVRQD